MGDTHIDPAVFKAQQREQWSNVAQGWRRRWAAFERASGYSTWRRVSANRR